MKISSTSIQLAFLLLVGCVNEYLAQVVNYGNCRSSYYIQPNTVQYIRSPGYPRNYTGGQNCQYQLTTDPGYQINLNCRTDSPQTTNCAGDRLDVARSGSLEPNTDQRFCGSRTFITTSYTNQMTFSQLSPGGFPQSPGGTYYCRAYPSPGCDCGRSRKTRIVGGVQSVPNVDSSVVTLFDRTTGAYCGGTIIDATTIVTAAHCLTSGNVNNLLVRVGARNLSDPFDTPYVADYPIQSVRIHEGYNPETFANDIAVVRTAPISYNFGVGAACLPWSLRSTTFENDEVTAYGYGAGVFGGPAMNVLYEAPLDVLSTQRCNNQGAPRGISVTGSQICTFRSGSDFCQNDSGGKLGWLNPETGLYYILGVQSYGYACALDAPGVSTRITSYLDWILANTPGARYCNV